MDREPTLCPQCGGPKPRSNKFCCVECYAIWRESHPISETPRHERRERFLTRERAAKLANFTRRRGQMHRWTMREDRRLRERL